MNNEIVSFSVRVKENLHAKLRILAAFRNVSINTIVNEAIGHELNQWEQKYGFLPQPPEELQQ